MHLGQRIYLVFQIDTIRLRFPGESCAARIFVEEALKGGVCECASQVVGVKTASYHAAVYNTIHVPRCSPSCILVLVLVRSAYWLLIPGTRDDVFCPAEEKINRQREIVPSNEHTTALPLSTCTATRVRERANFSVPGTRRAKTTC